MTSKQAILEGKGSERYLLFEDPSGPRCAAPESPSNVVPEEHGLTWTLYGGGVYECEVWVLQEDDGSFSAFAARLPGVVAQGDDPEHAFYEIQRALTATIISYKEVGQPVPWSDEPIKLETEREISKRWILVNA